MKRTQSVMTRPSTDVSWYHLNPDITHHPLLDDLLSLIYEITINNAITVWPDFAGLESTLILTCSDEEYASYCNLLDQVWPTIEEYNNANGITHSRTDTDI